MTEIRIINYKTLKDVSFKVDGFTLVYGRNYIGKSALVVAIMSALTNRSGDGFIRTGEKFCEVHIKRDGHTLIWHKENGNNFYVIDGKEYKKIGRADVPAPIKEMGFAPIEVAGEKTLLWYAKQFEALFLIDRNKTNYATDMIASASKLDPLYKAVDLINKDAKTAKADHKVSRTELLEVNEKLRILEPNRVRLEEIEPHINEAFGDLQGLEREIIFINENISKLALLKEEIVRTHPVTTLKGISTGELEVIAQDIKKLEPLATRFTLATTELERHKAAEDLPEVPESLVAEVIGLSKMVKELSSLYCNYVLFSNERESLSKVENLQDPSSVLQACEDLHETIQEITPLLDSYLESQRVLNNLSPISRLPEIPSIDREVEELNSLSALYSKAVGAKMELTSVFEEFKTSEKELQEAELAYSKIDVCPACGRDLC